LYVECDMYPLQCEREKEARYVKNGLANYRQFGVNGLNVTLLLFLYLCS
jgi:hypothetical protein